MQPSSLRTEEGELSEAGGAGQGARVPSESIEETGGEEIGVGVPLHPSGEPEHRYGRYAKDVKRGTLSGILSDAGLSRHEFLRLLK